MPTKDSKFDIAKLANAAEDFEVELAEVKKRAAPPDFPWYPYDSMGNFRVLDRLLLEPYRDLAELAHGHPILDVGCADGVTSFFLERAGFEVDIIDYPPTNFNGMRGLHVLKGALRSNVGIHATNLDAQFTLPRAQYGLVFFLGLLYHLKNPFYALETLARHTRFCFLSTRVAKFAPDKKHVLDGLPVAYLVAPDETNNDPTNFWIFSMAGLERLFFRTGWQLRSYVAIGNTKDSDPASQKGDERAFCLLESCRNMEPANMELMSGWFEMVQDAWRWTADRFSVKVPSRGPDSRTLIARFILPESTFAPGMRYLLHVNVDGREIGTGTYTSPGSKTLKIHLESVPRAGEPVLVECQLEPPQPKATGDSRKLGVVVRFVDDSGRPTPDAFAFE